MQEPQMNSGNEQKFSSYRWVILFILFVGQVVCNAAIFQIGGLANRLIPELHLDGNQFALILSVPMLAAAIIGIPAGAMADRFGVKNVIAVGLIIGTISLYARVTADNFWILFCLMFLIGIANTSMNSNAAKLLGAWFPLRKVGTVIGIYVAGMGVGTTTALATAAFFPTIRSAFLTMAVGMTIYTVLWILLVQNRPVGAETSAHHAVSMGEALKVASQSKNIWIGAIALFVMMGSCITQSGFLTNSLIVAKGVDHVLAGFVASAYALSFPVGGIVGPILAEKIGVTRPFLAPTAILCAIASYVGWIVPFGPLTWVFMILSGLFLGMSVPLIMSMPMALPEVGPRYAGSGGGIINTMQMAGAFLISSYVIVPLAGSDTDKIFLYLSIGYFIYGLICLPLPELGRKSGHGHGH
jgi:NNP family nitrate/nitrite transporter-like MFS transporter